MKKLNLFDRRKFVSNVDYFSKQQNIKRSYLESKTGLSPGYISRIGRTNILPSIENVANIAEILGVSISTLLNADTSQFTPTDEYLTRFITKLNNDTCNDKLQWKKEENINTESIDLSEPVKNCFTTNLFQDTPVYLIQTTKNIKIIWIPGLKDSSNFMITTQNSKLKNIINELYISIKQYTNRPKLDEHILKIIDDFIQN